MKRINFVKVVRKFDRIIRERGGFCIGLGARAKGHRMCVEAAICYALDEPHGDQPSCVAEALASFKIQLNDSWWSSPKARAKGLRDLGVAQLGSKGKLCYSTFQNRLWDLVKQDEALKPYIKGFKYTSNVSWGLYSLNSRIRTVSFYGAVRSDKLNARLATLAVQVLTDMKIPGAIWLAKHKKRTAK